VSYEDYDRNPVLLALDLASVGAGALTLDEMLDRQALMFTDHGYPATTAELDRGHVSALAGLSRELAGVLAISGDAAFYPALAVLLDAQDCRPQLTTHDGVGPHLHFARDGAPLPTWIATMAVSGLVLYVCRHGRRRLRRCAAVGCGRWYLDESKNSSRRYCSHACASRTTVAAHRARQAAGTRARPSGGA
jgi:predicted RNA-binding Zn ribbon-like protein